MALVKRDFDSITSERANKHPLLVVIQAHNLEREHFKREVAQLDRFHTLAEEGVPDMNHASKGCDGYTFETARHSHDLITVVSQDANVLITAPE